MIVKSIFLTVFAGFMGLSAAMMLGQENETQSLERSLGPAIETQKL